MVEHEELPDLDRQVPEEQDERPRDDDEALEVALDADGTADASGDVSGRSYDELADRARAVIEREHVADKAELEPDDASAAVIASEPAGPDADERPV